MYGVHTPQAHRCRKPCGVYCNIRELPVENNCWGQPDSDGCVTGITAAAVSVTVYDREVVEAHVGDALRPSDLSPMPTQIPLRTDCLTAGSNVVSPILIALVNEFSLPLGTMDTTLNRVKVIGL